MRTAYSLLLSAAITLWGTGAMAQTPAAEAADSSQPAPSTGEVDIGAQFGSGLEGVGRFQRMVDPRSGPALQRLRYARDRDTWTFNAQMDHVGYRDQRYFASFERYGKVKTSFEWNQVPLFLSGVSQTPYTRESPGVLRLPDAIQAAVQSRTATIADFAGELRGFETRSRRDTAIARVTYSATQELDLSAAFSTTARDGVQPWGASFGFNNAIELAVPVEHRTNDLNATAEWSNQRGMARVAYDASWFNNQVETLIWDNPLRATDQTHANAYSAGDGAAQGRMALWPDSTAHTVSAAGSIALPARSRAFGSVSIGSWLQDQQLLPHTINTAIAPIPLPRDTADAEARIVSMNYRLTSRPTRSLWLNASFKHYDYDNRTPHFAVGEYVRLDGNVATSVTGGSEPFEYTRRFVDLDASYTPFRFVAFRAGYGQEHDDRTFRLLEETTEHTIRTSIDSTGFSWGSLRLQYDHSERTGDGLDEEVFSDIGEQISLRQFDISDRRRDRVSAVVQVLPWESAGVSASFAVGRENRPDAAFGLQDNDFRAVTIGLDFVPADLLTLGLSYGFETYSTRQRSRQANPGVQFDDPTRDWSTDFDEDVHTTTAVLELPRLTERTAIRVAYDYVHSNAAYVYVLPSNSTLVAPQQLPPIRNAYHRATADLHYTLTRQMAVAVGYWLDKYDVQDFALGENTLSNPLNPGYVSVLYQWRPYDVHTGFARLIYSW